MRARTAFVQDVPTVCDTISEDFGLAPGIATPGRLVAALRNMGFDKVYGFHDAAAELRPAGHVSRESVCETTGALAASTLRKAVVCCIGPAGEIGAGGSILASLASDLIAAAGGNGLGAVMGSKRLKAVVVRGGRGGGGLLGFRSSRKSRENCAHRHSLAADPQWDQHAAYFLLLERASKSMRP